jgi:hypothetical protein
MRRLPFRSLIGLKAPIVALAFLTMPLHAQGTHRNIVFTNVPDFLKNAWTLVLGPVKMARSVKSLGL